MFRREPEGIADPIRICVDAPLLIVPRRPPCGTAAMVVVTVAVGGGGGNHDDSDRDLDR
jgi:hypothetical protein